MGFISNAKSLGFYLNQAIFDFYTITNYFFLKKVKINIS